MEIITQLHMFKSAITRLYPAIGLRRNFNLKSLTVTHDVNASARFYVERFAGTLRRRLTRAISRFNYQSLSLIIFWSVSGRTLEKKFRTVETFQQERRQSVLRMHA